MKILLSPAKGSCVDNDADEALGQLRQFAVELVMQLPLQERETIQEAFDVWVVLTRPSMRSSHAQSDVFIREHALPEWKPPPVSRPPVLPWAVAAGRPPGQLASVL